ncbi:MAG: amidohydrolase family protein [Phycisphaeraceae bacterium]|nr:amidohydrolase family protein [Phycisphaeraceae bacterium]
MDQPRDIRLFQAAGVLDAEGVCEAPGAVLAEHAGDSLCILAAGSPGAVESHPLANQARRLDLGDVALIPGLVNTHTHLDLSHIGPQPYDPVRGRFGDWLAMILCERATTEEAVEDSVSLGVELSLQGGVVAVGDISGVWSTIPCETLRESPLIGVSYIEAFGIGARQEESARRIGRVLDGLVPDAGGVRAGISPHAPYTVGTGLYRAILKLARSTGSPVATHLAESDPERAFIGSGSGLFRELLSSMGLWDETILHEVGQGRTPISHFFSTVRDDVAAAAGRAPVLIVHCNDVSDEDLDTLAQAPVSVAYCPRSSSYFGAERRFGPHRYAEMLQRGINVVLGTDSVVNLPARCGGGAPAISTLDEIRFLYERDGDSGGRVSPRRLLSMATTNAALALGMAPGLFTLSPGATRAILAVEIDGAPESAGLAEAVARSSGDPRMVMAAFDADPAPPVRA